VPFDPAPFFILTAAHIVLLALGIPLALGRVKRNQWYGFRTPSTLTRDEVWYPVNTAFGQVQSALVGCSLVVMLLGMVSQPGERWIQAGVIGIVFATFASIIYGLIVLQKAKASRSTGSR
jgi:hydrogenase-4 membrane subunit HyfE